MSAIVSALIPGAVRLSASWIVFLLRVLLHRVLPLLLREKTRTSALPAAVSTSLITLPKKFLRITAVTASETAEKLMWIVAVLADHAPTAECASITATAGLLIALMDYAEGFIVPTA